MKGAVVAARALEQAQRCRLNWPVIRMSAIRGPRARPAPPNRPPARRGATAAAAIYAVAFVTGAIVMSFEMLGSRYLNPYFGSGIYTWAALISTVLIALTAGYFLGGSWPTAPPRPPCSHSP